MGVKLDTSSMSAATAASLVRRMVAKTDDDGKVVVDKQGNPVPVAAKIKEDEVMSHAEYDDKVVVVTVAGEKLTCEKSSDIYKDWAAKQKK